MRSVNIAANEISYGYWNPSPKTKLAFILLTILAWIIFVGLSIEAGSFIVNAIFVLVKPEVVQYLWLDVDLSPLFSYDHGHFFIETAIMSVVAILKAVLFYFIIQILQNKKISISQPFSDNVKRFVERTAVITLLIGLFSLAGAEYTYGLKEQGVKMPDLQDLRLGGADVWLFMSIILFVIVHVFKKGIALQQENDLTV